MVTWLLIAWLCTGPGQCSWEIVGRYSISADCEMRAMTYPRYARCIEMTVPLPGSPGR